MPQRMDYEAVIPRALKGLGVVYGYVHASGLAAELVDLVYLRVSQINGCAYCIDAHSRDAKEHGVLANKLALLVAWREAGLFSEREKAALGWAESLTLVAQTHAPDEDYALLSANFSEQEIADLTVAICLMNAYNRLAIGFRRGPASAPET